MNPLSAIPVSTYENLDEAQNNAAPQQTAPVQPQNTAHPNFFEKILPTAGGILGGIGGAVLGDGVGGIAGASAGDALGKSLEDALTGQSATKGVLGSAIEGGAGQATGGILGSIGGKVLGGVSSLADKTVAPLLVKQSGDLLDHDTANYLAQNGITNFKQATNIGKQLTGATGGDDAVLSNAVTDAANNSSAKINLTNEGQNWSEPLAKYPGIKPSAIKDINKTVQDTLSQMSKDSGYDVTSIPQKGGEVLNVTDPSAISNISPGAALTASKSLRSVANAVGAASRDASGTVVNINNAAAQDVYNNLAKSIEDKTLGTGLDGNTLIPLQDSDKQTLKDSISGLEKTNPDLHSSLSQQFDNANNWQDIRSIQQPWVKVSQANRALEVATNKAPGVGTADLTGAVAGGLGKKGIAGAVIGAATKNKAADAAAAGGLHTLAGTVGKVASGKMLPLLSRMGALGAANLPNDVSTPTGQEQSTLGGLPQGDTNAASGGATMQQNPLDQLYQQLLQQQQAGAGLTANSGALDSSLASLAPQVQQQQQLAPVISNLESTYNNAGGAQGAGSGLLSRLSALIPGTAANTYQRQQAVTADAIAKLLGITPQAAMQSLPSLMSTPGTAAPQLGGLNSILGSIGTQ